MNVPVRAMAPGERSLPAQLHGRHIGWDRLKAGQHLPAPMRTLPPTVRSINGIGLLDISSDGYDSGAYGPLTMDSSGQIYDTSGDTVVLPTDTSTVTWQDPSGNTTTQSMSPTDLANLIAASTNSLAKILAISQGGSTSATGNIYGSAQTATTAAQTGNVLASPLGTASLSSTGVMIAAAFGFLVLLMMARK